MYKSKCIFSITDMCLIIFWAPFRCQVKALFSGLTDTRYTATIKIKYFLLGLLLFIPGWFVLTYKSSRLIYHVLLAAVCGLSKKDQMVLSDRLMR